MLKVAQQLQLRWPKKASRHDEADRPSNIQSSKPLFNWYVKPARMKEMDVVLFINEATLTPIVVPGIDFLRVDVRLVFQEVLLQMLALEKVSHQKARTYIEQCLSNEQFEPNLTTNFMVEKTTQEYRQTLVKQEIDLVHDQEEGRLMHDLVNLSHQLTSTSSYSSAKLSPTQQLASQINELITIAAEIGKNASKLRLTYHQWAGQRSLTPKDKGFDQVCQQIRELNAHFLSGFKDWLSQSLEKKALDNVIKIVTDFQNHFLLTQHPLTICDDLTAVSSYLTKKMPQNNQQVAITYLRAFDLMGQYVMGIKLWTDNDFKVYHDALIDGGQGLVQSVSSAHDKQAAYLKMVYEMLVELTDQQTAVLRQALAKLSTSQRRKLQKILHELDNSKKEE